MYIPIDYKALKCKRIFIRKYKTDGTIDKQPNLKDYKRKEGYDFFDCYEIDFHRVLLPITALHNLESCQMNMIIPFLNSELEEEIYMEQSEGFVVLDQERKVNAIAVVFKV